MTASASAGLRRRSVRGVAWQSVAAVVAMGTQAVLALVAARIVGPAAFAVWGVASVVFNGQHLLAILGLGPALIRHAREDTDEQALLDTAVLATAVVAVPGAIALAVAAPAVASMFGLSGAGAADVVRVAAAVVAILVVGQVTTAVLERQLLFAKRAMVDLAATAVYALLTVVLLFAGAGIWALLWGRLAHSVTTLLAGIVLSPVRPALTGGIDRGLLRGLVRFGGPVGVSAIAAVAFTNLDTLAVGRLHGADELGRYALAYSVATFVPTLAAVTIGRVYFASLSAAGAAQRPGLLRDLFRWCALAAAGTGIALAAGGPVLEAVFGDAWSGLAHVLLPLALYAAARIGSLAVNTATAAVGRPVQLVVNELVGLAVALSVIPLLGDRGAAGIALAFAIGQTANVAVGALALRISLRPRAA